MLKFSYRFRNIDQYQHSLARFLKVSPQGYMIQYPEGIARGFSLFRRISRYITCQIVNYNTHSDISFNRLPSRDDHFIIIFKNFRFECRNGINICSDQVATVQCTTNGQPEQILIPKGTQLRVLRIYIAKKHIAHFLSNDTQVQQLNDFISTAINSTDRFYLNTRQAELLSEITQEQLSVPLEHLYIDSRIQLLLENFFNTVLSYHKETLHHGLRSEELYCLKKIEDLLVQHHNQPFPGIHWLARASCLSRTRLINLFKQVHNMGPGEFHHHKRMQAAYNLIASGTHSVTETASLLGYRNYSHFTSAFKKAFGCLPSALQSQTQKNNSGIATAPHSC
jgi:AraC-like DNA-binding protein